MEVFWHQIDFYFDFLLIFLLKQGKYLSYLNMRVRVILYRTTWYVSAQCMFSALHKMYFLLGKVRIMFIQMPCYCIFTFLVPHPVLFWCFPFLVPMWLVEWWASMMAVAQLLKSVQHTQNDLVHLWVDIPAYLNYSLHQEYCRRHSQTGVFK